jgi:hypothetical protein
MPLPEPVPALVIRYAYLWQAEQQRGQSEGVKEDPVSANSLEKFLLTLGLGTKRLPPEPLGHDLACSRSGLWIFNSGLGRTLCIF